jgi:hypothetical protein
MSLDQLVAQVRQATDHQSNRAKLKQQIETDLLLPYGDGLFRISSSLIAFLNSWTEDVLVLEDEYGNPISCDRNDLLEKCKERYQLVMNRWHVQYEQLRNIRKI